MLRQLIRVPGFRRLWLRFPFGSLDTRIQFDVSEKASYAYGVNSAAQLARGLGLNAISVIEFGVAGGNGLLALQNLSREIGAATGVRISVYGFDSGEGMPSPLDYRDLPHVWDRGFYAMDVAKLQKRLDGAQLVLGDVRKTVPEFLERRDLEPIGFIAFDLDYYSSTKAAFGSFAGSAASRLPRVFCYFDDVLWPERACYNDYVGELCAIREYNEEHARQKIARIPGLSWMRPRPAYWNDQMYVHHDFDHPLYTKLITPEGGEYRTSPLA